MALQRRPIMGPGQPAPGVWDSGPEDIFDDSRIISMVHKQLGRNRRPEGQADPEWDKLKEIAVSQLANAATNKELNPPLPNKKPGVWDSGPTPKKAWDALKSVGEKIPEAGQARRKQIIEGGKKAAERFETPPARTSDPKKPGRLREPAVSSRPKSGSRSNPTQGTNTRRGRSSGSRMGGVGDLNFDQPVPKSEPTTTAQKLAEGQTVSPEELKGAMDDKKAAEPKPFDNVFEIKAGEDVTSALDRYAKHGGAMNDQIAADRQTDIDTATKAKANAEAEVRAQVRMLGEAKADVTDPEAITNIANGLNAAKANLAGAMAGVDNAKAQPRTVSDRQKVGYVKTSDGKRAIVHWGDDDEGKSRRQKFERAGDTMVGVDSFSPETKPASGVDPNAAPYSFDGVVEGGKTRIFDSTGGNISAASPTGKVQVATNEEVKPAEAAAAVDPGAAIVERQSSFRTPATGVSPTEGRMSNADWDALIAESTGTGVSATPTALMQSMNESSFGRFRVQRQSQRAMANRRMREPATLAALSGMTSGQLTPQERQDQRRSIPRQSSTRQRYPDYFNYG